MHHQHCTQNKKECFPVAGSSTIYFPGFTGALPVDSAYFEVREDGKLWIKERLSKRQCHIFFFFFSRGSLCYASGLEETGQLRMDNSIK